MTNFSAQPPRFLIETVMDPASKSNFDIANRNIQDINKLQNRNFYLSSSVSASYSTAKKVTGLEGRIVTSKNPILGALVPVAYSKPVIVGTVFAAGGASSLQIYASSGAATPASCHASLDIFRNSNKAYTWDAQVQFAAGSTSNEYRLPPFQLLFFDPQPAGDYRYEVFINSLASGVAISFNYLQLLLVEL